MSHSKKLCGILIENTVSNDTIIRSIIGVGLNVNQVKFDADLTNATSMKQVTNMNFDRAALLRQIIDELKKQIQLIEERKFKVIKRSYEKHLHRINTVAMYRDTLGNQFMGKILGINALGNLVVELENESTKSFDLKEIQFI